MKKKEQPRARPISARMEKLSLPQLWPLWPKLPVLREIEKELEFGILIDLFHSFGVTGYSSTVFLRDVEKLPKDLPRLLNSPKRVYDTPEEVAKDGWVPD